MSLDLIPKSQLGQTIKVSNDFARAHWSSESIWEVRIVSAIASLVKNTDEEFHTYKVPLNILTGREKMLGRNYSDIKRAIHKLTSRRIEIRGGGKNPEKNFRIYTLFALCGIEDGNLVAGFHPDLMPLFLNLKNRFTLYAPRDIMCLPSVYSQRLFMLLKSWIGKDEVVIPLEELHSILNATPSLAKKYANFKERVLNQAHRDINKLTSMQFEWRPVIQGRTVKAIHFFLSPELYRNIRDQRQKEEDIKEKCLRRDIFLKIYKCLEENPDCHSSQGRGECCYCDRNPDKITVS